MFPIRDLKSVTLELTTNCNASCPQCSRNFYGGVKIPSLPFADLSLSDIKIIFPASLVQQLSSIRLTGNYGDPMVSKDSLAICKYFRELNPELNLTFHTNASGRSKSWWQELAKLVTECFFAIDGLEDTNCIYRRNTNWTQIMNIVTSFIGAGGIASWNFLIFEHNQDQISAAADLAKKLGFRNFYPKKTGRFLRSGKAISGKPQYNSASKLVGELKVALSTPIYDPACNLTYQ
jgi:MoaA/NifB/PqqE/SkfB family radical SAM enzyme